MVETRTCGQCSRFKLLNGGCPHYDSFFEYVGGRPLMDVRCAACSDFHPARKTADKKARKQLKDSGVTVDGPFEAICHNGKPAFLVKNSETFSIVESLEINGETIYPKDVKHIPYEPYGYYEGAVPNQEDLFWKVNQEFQTFIDVEPVWKDVLSTGVLLSHHQEKLQTVPYLFLYGDNESGKSTVLQLMKYLCYRPMYGVTIPSADLYGYLEDSDSIGTILEDEIQGIHKDTDKIKIYKAGYKQGAVVPRTIITQHDRIIKYYRTFCFKACASEQIPQVKGFNERFLFISMVEGSPEKEWADITREDLDRLHDLRDMLLKWRLQSRAWQLPEFQLPMKGRVKELWKPLLQITHGLTVYDGLFGFVEDQKNERLSARQNTLEGHVVKVVSSLYNQGNETIPFSDVWRELVSDLDGKLDDKKPHVMDTSEFFQVTKNKVGYRLREVLSGKTTVLKERDSEGDRVSVKAYVFDSAKLRKVAKKYGYEVSTKLPSLPSSEGVQAPKTMEKVGENNVENTTHAHLKLGRLSNTVDSQKQSSGLGVESSSISENSVEKSVTRNKDPNSVDSRGSEFDLNSSVTEDNVLGWLRLDWKGGTEAAFDELLKSQGYSEEQAVRLRQRWLDQGVLRQDSGSLVLTDGEDEKAAGTIATKVRHIPPGEPCELCHGSAAEWQIMEDNDNTRMCNGCFNRLRANGQQFTFLEGGEAESEKLRRTGYERRS